MARTTTRNTQTRELETREEEYTYSEPNLLEIPQAVTDRFLEQGMKLRWLRTTIKGSDDYANIGKRMQEGYEFVSLDEVPEMAHSARAKSPRQTVPL